MKLVLVIYALGPGGAQRQLSGMANYWARKGWPVALLTLSKRAGESFYTLHDGVTRICLNALGSPTSFGSAIAQGRQALGAIRAQINELHPEAVISFIDQTNILTIAATWGLGVPVIVSERINTRFHHIGWHWATLRRLLYPLAARVVVQCEENRRDLPLGTRGRSAVIPNFLAPERFTGRDARSDPRCMEGVVIAMGRLVPQKGFDLLIRAFALLSSEFANWSLEIRGEGPMRGQLEQLAQAHGLQGRIRFPGISRTPEQDLARADIFVLSSRFEGFPNVLLEAMAAGLAVVSFACPTGPKAIIRHEIDGLLVPPEDLVALSSAMRRLMKDYDERRRLAARAPQVLARFSAESVMTQWESLLVEVTS